MLLIDQDIQRRPATHKDKPFLRELFDSTRVDQLRNVPWSAERLEGFLSTQFNAQSSHYKQAYPQSHCDVIEVNKAPAGRLWVNQTNSAIHILDITIHENYRNQGVGSYLMQELITLSETTNTPITLNVWHDNSAARRFYNRFEFKPVSAKDGYIFMKR